MVISIVLAAALTQLPQLKNDGAESGCQWGKTHQHALQLDKNGEPTVYHYLGQPDLVMDGKCHDDNTEEVVAPKSYPPVLKRRPKP